MDCIYAFSYKRNFGMVYQTTENTIKHLIKPIRSPNNIRDNFKFYWNKDDIELFNDRIERIWLHDNHNYDGIIYVISCSGSRSDSTGEPFTVKQTADRFNNQNLGNIAACPKIFIIDCDRGATAEPRTYINNDSNNPSKNHQKLRAMDVPNLTSSIFAPGESDRIQNLENIAQQHVTTEYSKNSDVMYIYSTLNNQSNAKQKQDKKATLLIRSITKAISDDRIFYNNNLHGILHCTKSILQQLLNDDTADRRAGQVMEVHSTMSKNLYLVS